MNQRQQIYIKHIFLVFIILVFGYFILGELFLPSDQLGRDDYHYAEYKGEWVQILPSGEKRAFHVPGRCHAKRDEVVVVETVLPSKIAHNRYLCFRSAKQDMKFYIDGKLRQQYSNKDSRLFGRMSAAAYIFLSIDTEDAGKTLRVETQTDSSYTGIFYKVYAGSPMEIWNYLFRQYGMELIVAFIALILSLIAIAGGMVLRFFYHRKIVLEYLGWGTLFAAVWLITNSAFRQLLFPNLSVVNDMTFLMIMLLAIPFLIYMDQTQKARYRRIYQGLEIVVTANFFLCTTLHMTGVCDYTDTVRYVAVFCVLSILFMIGTMVRDIRKGYIREYLFVAVGMFGVCIAAFVQIILYFQKSNLFNGLILAIGLVFLLLFSTISTIQEIQKMEKDKQSALQASESKGRFLANMSHEIRTPIHAVLGMDAMILRESTETKIKEYALDIQNAGQTLLALINDILDISKIESGKLEILSVEYDFSSLIHDVVNMMKMKAQDKELEFKLSVEEAIPSRMKGDDVRLRQILVNLLNNAIKYTEQGSVALRISGRQKENIEELTFRIEDTGIGIREEDMEKLFLEFARIEEERNRRIEGTGLGMSITTQLLQLMESRLEVQSTYGEGSTFFFTLKQEIVSAEPIGDLEKRIRNQAVKYSYEVMFTAPDARILIVDDNAVNRRVFMNLLKATKIQVEEVASGEQCLEYVKEKAYDLIFMDHMMPGLDGVETLHIMQSWENYPCKATPVIALTANAVTGARESYLEEGFQGFLSKPVRPEKMEKLIMEMLSKEKVIQGMQAHNNLVENEKEETKERVFAEIEGIDWKYARMYCRDSDILLDTVHQFYIVSDQEADKLAVFWRKLAQEKKSDRTEVFRRFRVQIHAMKNSAAMIGAVSLSGVARMLEYAARDQKIEVIEAVTPYFLEEWHDMKQKLCPMIQEQIGRGNGTKCLDGKEIENLIDQLQKAMGEMDVDTADRLMEELGKFTYKEGAMQEAVTYLGMAVADLDEEQTEVWGKKLKQEMKKVVVL